MNTLVALPDYEQTGDIQVMGSAGIMPLHKALTFSDFPKTCEIAGIPSPVLSKHLSERFIFSQIVRAENKVYFLKSCRAGKDKTGRIVFLTFIFEFSKKKANKESLLTAKCNLKPPSEELKIFFDLLNTFGDDESRITDMIGNFEKKKNNKYFASCELSGLKYKTDRDFLANVGLSKKKIVLLILVILSILAIYFVFPKNYVHG